MQPEPPVPASHALPLEGVVVLDFSQFLAGPVAALRLADLGARVVKVERPVTGEIGRTLAFAGRWLDGDTYSFHAMNRSKQSVVADLKDPADLVHVKRLVARADVLVQNFRPGVMQRLGLDEASVRATNPRLVYASASGYGESGPWVDRPGQDLLAQAVSALPWAVGSGERPVPVGLALADHLMSCHLAMGITALLVRAARTGVGGLVQTSLLEAMLDLQVERLTDRLSQGNAADQHVHPRPTGRSWVPAGVYPTADGHLAVGAVSFDRLGEALGDPVLAAAAACGDWWKERGRLATRISDRLREWPTEHWVRELDGSEVWVAPLRTLEELVASEEFDRLAMMQVVTRRSHDGSDGVRVRTTRSPIRIDGRLLGDGRAAPRLGEDGLVADAERLVWSGTASGGGPR